MRALTATEFQLQVAANPRWAADLAEPLEVSTYCNMQGSPIQKLSPFLHFKGRTDDGSVADFSNCKCLTHLEGHFYGWSNFGESGIETIGDLTVHEPDAVGEAMSLAGCSSLQTASGTFHGRVDFSNSGIQSIGELRITPASTQQKAIFLNCTQIKHPPAYLLGKDYIIDAQLRGRIKTQQRKDAQKKLSQGTGIEI